MRKQLFSNILGMRKLSYEYFKPCINNTITYSYLKKVRYFSTKKNDKLENVENINNTSHNLSGSLSSNYKVFDDKDAETIYDISEVEKTIELKDLQVEEEQYDPYEGINLERGVSGVFEIEDLVSLLQRENAKNIFVVTVPPKLSYVNYLVVVTGKSQKHMIALATFIRKIYKLKRHKTDLIPPIEGQDSKDWVALDLGNIALHVFSKSARILYDLETLWAIGPEYDKKNEKPSVDVMEQFNKFLSDMNPIEDENVKNDNK